MDEFGHGRRDNNFIMEVIGMKKLITSLVLCCSVLSVIVIIAVSNTNAEVDMNIMGTIFVDNVEINNKDTIVISENEMLIPLRTVFEALGSKVVWEENTGNVYFDYAELEYICKFVALNQNFPENKSILICKVENKDSINNADYIQLNPMSADGTYRMINDRTYLYQQTGQRLLEALGCTVDIDLEQQILRISSK